MKKDENVFYLHNVAISLEFKALKGCDLLCCYLLPKSFSYFN